MKLLLLLLIICCCCEVFGNNYNKLCDVNSIPHTSTLKNKYNVKLNKQINIIYERISICFQSILEPQAQKPSEFGTRFSNWYVMASYASRVAGMGEYALMNVIQQLDPSLKEVKTLSEKEADNAVQNVLSKKQSLTRALRRKVSVSSKIATFLVKTFNALCYGMKAGNTKAMFNLDIIKITMNRLKNILNDKSTPGNNWYEKLKVIPYTLLNTLEEGNRAIAMDVQTGAIEFFQFRKELKRPPTNDEIIEWALNKYSLRNSKVGGPVSKEGIEAAYQWAISDKRHDFDLQVNLQFEKDCKVSNGRDFYVAAFMLYELAAKQTNLWKANPLIRVAASYIAYHEQKYTVKDVFHPPKKVATEAKRSLIFQMMTPTIHLALPHEWTFAQYAKENKNSVNVKNADWGNFQDRWKAILDSFQMTYIQHDHLFPLPSVDAKHGVKSVNIYKAWKHT